MPRLNRYKMTILLVTLIVVIAVTIMYSSGMANKENMCLQEMRLSIEKLPEKLVYRFHPMRLKDVTILPLSPHEILQEKIAGEIWKKYFSGEPKWTVGFYKDGYPDIFIAGDAFLAIYKISNDPIRYKVSFVLKNVINVMIIDKAISDPQELSDKIIINDTIENYTDKIDSRHIRIIVAKEATVYNTVELDALTWIYKSDNQGYGTWIYQKPCDNAVLFQPILYMAVEGDYKWCGLHYLVKDSAYPVYLISKVRMNKSKINMIMNSDFLNKIARFSIKESIDKDRPGDYYIWYNNGKYYPVPEYAPYLLVYDKNGILKEIMPSLVYYGEAVSEEKVIPQFVILYLVPPPIHDLFDFVMIKPFGVSELLAGLERVN